MNQTSVDDFIGTILLGWYARASAWMPPGDDARRCDFCASSVLSALLPVERWPHDLIHQLASSLTTAEALVRTSLEEERDPRFKADPVARLATFRADDARRLVVGALLVRSAEILDVLEECVRYRLDDHSTVDLEHSLLELDPNGLQA